MAEVGSPYPVRTRFVSLGPPDKLRVSPQTRLRNGCPLVPPALAGRDSCHFCVQSPVPPKDPTDASRRKGYLDRFSTLIHLLARPLFPFPASPASPYPGRGRWGGSYVSWCAFFSVLYLYLMRESTESASFSPPSPMRTSTQIDLFVRHITCH